MNSISCTASRWNSTSKPAPPAPPPNAHSDRCDRHCSAAILLIARPIRCAGRCAGCARGSNEEEPSRREGNYLWRWLAIGATGFAVITLLLRPAGMSERDRFLNDAVGSHVRSLMVEHLTDVASSDRHTVKPWFDGKLDFAPDVKDFAAQDFPLVGGRLDYLNGRAVAALVYRRNKHLINVFVWPSRNAGDDKTENLRGYSVINRDARGLHYCLVSDLNEKELRELADLLVK